MTYKKVVRHLGTVHAHESAFYVECCVLGCPRTYTNFHSYKSHLYKRHREVIIDLPSASETNDTLLPSTTEIEPPSPQSNTCTSESDLLVASTSTSRQREAALFILKAKHLHKVSQNALNGLQCDISSMLETTVHQLEVGVMDLLHMSPLREQVRTVFHSPIVTDPFCGLTSKYMQKSFYKAEFQLVVSYRASIIVCVYIYPCSHVLVHTK